MAATSRSRLRLTARMSVQRHPQAPLDDRERGWSSALFPAKPVDAGRPIEGCQRAVGPQRNCPRLATEVSVRQQQGTSRQSVCAEIDRAEAVMSGLTIFRIMANIFDALTVRPGRGGHPTDDGKIKAARCGAVGRRKSAMIRTWRNVRMHTTVCRFAQVLVISTLAHLVCTAS